MKTPAITADFQHVYHHNSSGSSMLPIHSMSTQTQHILQTHSNGRQHTQRVLYVFAMVLTIAIACALLLVISSGTAFATPISAASTIVGRTSAILAIGLSMSASILAAITVVHLSLSFRR